MIDITKGKHLVIVESPAKSKTIRKYLGDRFEVKASMGHVVDLPKKKMGVDIEHNFKPTYEVSPDKKKTLSELKKAVKDVDQVWIATDEDREGEAIGWHVANALKLDIKNTPRIVFHEITKDAIQNAVKNPKSLNMSIVDAQQARRILDRLVGFELSPVLWKKVKPGLSAGRVQSVAVRIVVEREREINQHEKKSSFKVVGDFIGDAKQNFEAELSKKLASGEKVQAFLENIKGATFTVKSVETKPGKKSPSAPFVTSTLQQEASRKIGFSVSKTMMVAQKLYEAGLITYMRTDSVNLSDFAVKACIAEITKEYGAEYSNPTQYTSKSKGAQEAHECIRPTDMANRGAGSNNDEKRLYDLIWKRTLASQMAPAKLEKTKAEITISTDPKHAFIATGEVIKFDGFLKVYFESTDDEEEELQKGMLPVITEGESLDPQSVLAKELFAKHPPRYTEASLVKKLEEMGIGRPSTYAPTISTIQKRGYVVKESRGGVETESQEFTLTWKSGTAQKIEEITKTQTIGTEKNKIFPTDMGLVVTDYLVDSFSDIMDYNFTADVEKQFDHIAHGKLKWQAMMKEFYGPFHKEVEAAIGHVGRATGERDIGIDPKTGELVKVRIGRYGPMVQLGELDEEAGKKPKYASMPKDKTMEMITLEEALEAFKLPREIGEYEGVKIVAGVGRFGPYLRYDSLFVSIPKDERNFDPITIGLEDSIELVKAKIKAEKEKYINDFEYNKKPLQVLKGRYGPYIKYDKKNYKIPKTLGKDATDLTLEDCAKIVEGK